VLEAPIMDKKTSVIIIFLSVLVLIHIGITRYQAGELKESRSEVSELQNQILEYRMVSRPVLVSRGWLGWPIESVVEITPEVLKYAINPCYTTPSGNWDHSCGSGPRDIPIVIERLK
jgi:hypothetical protein